MNRDGERSRILFPGLVFLALLLFGIPEAQVDNVRGLALSALSPILSRFSAWRRPEPRVAAFKFEPPAMAASQGQPEVPVVPPENNSAEIDALRAKIAFYESEHQRLIKSDRFPGLPAKIPAGIEAAVIARKILWQEPMLGIDKGAADGVKMNAGVLHRGAVLGRIVAVGPHASSLALLTNRGMSIAARLAECRIEGVLQGSKEENGEHFCRMAIVAREASPKVGENVVTSGYDGAFPPDLWMGVVTAVHKTADFQWELTIRPACNDNAVEMVQIVTTGIPEVPWLVAKKGRGGN